MRTAPHRASALRRQGALAVLRHVHAHPGVTRAELSRALGLSSGSATELTARLKAQRLIEEGDAPPTGGRGRPSPALGPHPDGPLVCVVDISHERWRVAVVELGGRIVADQGGRHADRSAAAVLRVVRRRVAGVLSERVRLVSVSVAGTVQGTRVVQAAGLEWSDVPIDVGVDLPLLLGNDATLAALAEARRGAGAGARAVLHLVVEVGAGGALIVDGRPFDGATGAGGEFGHLPFGDPALHCPCGARGCWDLEVDGRAMARTLGAPPPEDPRTLADRILQAAAAGDAAARDAAAAAARAFGRGAGGLVNALDPDLVTLSGLAEGYAAVVGEDLRAGYLDGLMRFRRADPPPLRTSELGGAGPVAGAAEVAFDRFFTTWASGD